MENTLTPRRFHVIHFTQFIKKNSSFVGVFKHFTNCDVSAFLLTADVESDSFECSCATSPAPKCRRELCSPWQCRHRMVDEHLAIEWFGPRHLKQALNFRTCSRLLQFGNSWNFLHFTSAWPSLHIKHLTSFVMFVAFTDSSFRPLDLLSLKWLLELIGLDPEAFRIRTVSVSKELSHCIKNVLKSSYLGIFVLERVLSQCFFVSVSSFLLRAYKNIQSLKSSNLFNA